MVSHFGIPTPHLAQGRSRVSHKLQLSQQEKIKLHLTLFALFALFLACFTGILLLVDAVSSPGAFPPSRDEYHSRGASELDRLPFASLWALWAYYSPYHPAGKFEGSTRKGCIVSQVNIVSSVSPLRSISPTDPPPRHNYLAPLLLIYIASTPRCTISDQRGDQGHRRGARKASSCHYLQRP